MKRHAELRLTTLLLMAMSTIAQAAPNPQAPTAPVAETLNIPADTAFMAKLNTNIDVRQSKAGDVVEAQAAQDVKQGKQLLLKKGTTLTGHISSMEMPSSTQADTIVAIVFDSASSKNGPTQTLHLVIKALAPESNVTNNDTLAEGRGMGGATQNAGVGGHASTVSGNSTRLDTSSVGVSGMAGLQLGEKTTATDHFTILAWSKGDMKLKKGTQLVMKVVGQ